MGHTITIGLTQAAQRAAVLAGEPAGAIQTYEVGPADLPALLSLPYAAVGPSGDVTYYAHADGPGYSIVSDSSCYPTGQRRTSTTVWVDPLALDVRPRDGAHAISLVQAVHDARAQARAQVDAEVQVELARIAAKRADLTALLADAPVDLSQDRGDNAYAVQVGPGDVWRLVGRASKPYSSQPVERLPGLDGRVAEALRLDNEILAADAARTVERVLARLRRLASIVREHGDEAARGRLDAGPGPLGLLPEDEALALATDVRLPVGMPGSPQEYVALEEYVLLDEDDVAEYCHTDCDGTRRNFVTEEPGSLTAEEWTAVQATRKAMRAAGLPDGELRRHQGQCTRQCCPEWPVSRLGIRVRLDLGDGLVVSREYGVQS